MGWAGGRVQVPSPREVSRRRRGVRVELGLRRGPRPQRGAARHEGGAWKFGDAVETILLDKEGEVVATRDTKKEVESFGTSGKFSGRRVASAEGDRNCSIM